MSALSVRPGPSSLYRRVVAVLGRHRRDERAAEAWARFAAEAADRGLSMITVVHVYQVAHRGTKAIIEICGEPGRRDAWLWWDRAAAGSTLAVWFRSGYGPHTDRDGVVYIGTNDGRSGVCDRISAKTVAHARRHHRRSRSAL